MLESVFIMLETDIGGGGLLLGVFADRTHAIAAARSHAEYRIDRWHKREIEQFGLDPDGLNPYSSKVQTFNESTDVLIANGETGEHESLHWHVQRFDVTPNAHDEPEQLEHSSNLRRGSAKSRYEIPTAAPGVTVAIGWDNPLQTFFAQVARIQHGQEDDDESIMFWVGCAYGEVTSVERLAELIAAYAALSPEMATQLRADRAAALDRGPTALQRTMSGRTRRQP
jgi:hypothetical protein